MEKSYIEEEREQIIKELLRSKKIKPGQSINYEKFLELYKPYKDKMEEIQFAYLLEISSRSLQHLKTDKCNAKILKSMIKELTEEEKEKIIGEVLKSNQLKPGQFIKYNEFQKVYEPYEYIAKESEFASILDISYSNWLSIKHNSDKRTKALKSMCQEITSEEKKKILNEILLGNTIKLGQFINYEEFKKLYEPYKDKMAETEFASILDISYGNFKAIKNKKQRAKILKNNRNEIVERDILEEILQNEKIKPGQSINYQEFLLLYKPYKNKIQEKEFAHLLEISDSSWYHIKENKSKTNILKSKIEKITIVEKEKVINELIKSDKIKAGETIDYKRFNELYNPYKDKIKEPEFAELLGISYNKWQNIKNKNQRTRILKNKIVEITKDEKDKILKEVFNENGIANGQFVNYEQFKELYDKYKEKIKESEFAYLLGIKYDNFRNMKKRGTRAKIYDYKEKAERVKYIVSKESRYYTKEELNKMWEKYDLEVEAIIRHTCLRGTNILLQDYINVLQEKGQIYIGETKCHKRFANKYAKYILNNANDISTMYCKRYGFLSKREDIASESLVYFLEKCGDIEKNFKDEKIVKNHIIFRISSYIKYKSLREIFGIKEYPFQRYFYNYKGEYKEMNLPSIGIEDKTQNVQNTVEEKILSENESKNLEEECIKELKKNIELGLNKDRVLKETGKALGLNPEEILNALKNYMIKTKGVRKTRRWQIYNRRYRKVNCNKTGRKE